MTADRLREIHPAVLTGGRSRRFGRDKLLEPVGEPPRPLVRVPIEALRAVFGPRVRIVGDADPAVALLADGTIPDALPGTGPIGGVVSALEYLGAAVFVLGGDMPAFTPAHIRLILDASVSHTDAWAVLAATSSVLQPCAGIYRPAALSTLRSRLDSGRRSLHDALPGDRIVTVQISEPRACANINTPADLREWLAG